MVVVHDLTMAAISVFAALFFRTGGLGQFDDTTLMFGALLPFVGACAVAFPLTGLYRTNWRYASTADMLTIVRAATLAVLLYVPLSFVTTRLTEIPRSFVGMSWVVLIFLLAAGRVGYRLFREGRLVPLPGGARHGRTPVLIVGAGPSANLFLRALDAAGAEYHAAGFVADSISRPGVRLHGVPHLGAVGELAAVVARFRDDAQRPRRIVIADPDLAPDTLASLLDTAERLGVPVSRVPDMSRLRPGIDDKVELQPVSVEDLLGRPQIVLDETPVAAMVGGRRVLVTGAGGSIGAELVRQIAAFGPARMCLVDSAEFNLYAIDMEAAERWPKLARSARILDVRDAEPLRALLRDERPDIVFHAAALKHVPLVEANPLAAVAVNVLGTRNVADACVESGVRAMVMISTDKAVNPSSVMGATKRSAESYCQSLALERPATRFTIVRFGNVLGSAGSVVPLFRRQLEAGGPLTVTHPDIARFFMTIREAVQLVLHASALGMADGDAAGRVFVLDMGRPVKIVDLARQMIRLAGLRPDIDIKIAFTGLRPGEKLHEELFHGQERVEPTRLPRILIAAPRTVDRARLVDAFAALGDACVRSDTAAALAVLRTLVPEFRT
ncbi:MAG: polysaccharide biosynthesis protein [Rhodospirillales bacterium]|nr:MAG: polysaccharide biosynthesis protein [Rhodospirillales bacterium]